MFVRFTGTGNSVLCTIIGNSVQNWTEYDPDTHVGAFHDGPLTVESINKKTAKVIDCYTAADTLYEISVATRKYSYKEANLIEEFADSIEEAKVLPF